MFIKYCKLCTWSVPPKLISSSSSYEHSQLSYVPLSCCSLPISMICDSNYFPLYSSQCASQSSPLISCKIPSLRTISYSLRDTQVVYFSRRVVDCCSLYLHVLQRHSKLILFFSWFFYPGQGLHNCVSGICILPLSSVSLPTKICCPLVIKYYLSFLHIIFRQTFRLTLLSSSIIL